VAESSLSIKYADLLAEVGRYLGYGRDTAQWSGDERADVDTAIDSGLRQFYVPPPLPNDRLGSFIGHQWSFLRPVDILVTAVGTSAYDMPDDFGGLQGGFTFNAGSDRKTTVVTVGEGQIRALQQQSSRTGPPTFAAIRPKASDGSIGTRYEVVFWPTPDAVYTLLYRKVALALRLSDAYPYPLGGMEHGETIMAACLAAAEKRMTNTKGVHWDTFIERLNASVAKDRDVSTPDFMGYNGNHDNSENSSGRASKVTYNGLSAEDY
jgi:hypothetical protein